MISENIERNHIEKTFKPYRDIRCTFSISVKVNCSCRICLVYSKIIWIIYCLITCQISVSKCKRIIGIC